jgi:hypothetical protein
MVYKQRTINIVRNEVITILSPHPICVKIYFTPENADVKTEGIHIKNSN